MNFRQTEDIYVWADEFKVEQVVRNYVSNAFHHVSGDKVIEVKMIVEGDKVRVTVFNTGTPIPEEDIGHIWDKFYKVDKAHTREYWRQRNGFIYRKGNHEVLPSAIRSKELRQRC